MQKVKPKFLNNANEGKVFSKYCSAFDNCKNHRTY